MILLGEHTNYIKGYGFMSDLRGQTILGILKNKIEPYLRQGYKLKEEFIEDANLPRHEVKYRNVPPYMTIAKGTLKVWAIPESESNYSI